MKNITRLGFLLLLLLLIGSCTENKREKRVLIFSHTAGYRHEAIEDGIVAIKKLGRENGFNVFATEDPTQFNEKYLSMFSAVIFLNTTMDVLNNTQEADFERFIQAGGGFVGVHAAADTEYDWKWYNQLVGAYFDSHPEQQDAQMDVVDTDHPATKFMKEKRLTRFDEWYNYKSVQPDLKVLIKLDESSYKGGNMNGDHPIAWYHEFDGGRAFYTGWGHTKESYQEELFLKHLLGGINYAIGPNKLDYKKAVTYRIPSENRFNATVLADNLDEPMELDIFPDGRVILVERKGAVKLYDAESGLLELVTTIPVWDKFEDGLMGIAIDPNYEETNWVYVYYAPNDDKSRNQISRFTFDGRTWDYDSEKVILEVPTQRVTCCHSGGSLEFDKKTGNLYLSTGDDTNPFASDGFAPIDERPGHEPWDAQRTSANTNDLRGKVLRIHPEPDGSYTIPEGNLFPEGTAGAKPEIYVMGCRNPFRISIDSKKGWLYWGDVGPDAGKDGELRGPKGFDEINQAKEAGNYGWPYFRGDGKVYYDYDFVAGKSGELFNPEKPINNSANNTGLKELPPFRKSLIWYSYDESEEFPWVGTGGKNPMAGPVYYADEFADVENRFPDYFNGKLFFYEWMRNWIYIVKMDSLGNFVKADRFMPSTEFSRPMDMVFGKDGALYLLEYGQQWFARNQDARLTKIEYISGNLTPVARIEADKSVGGVPLTVNFSGNKSVDFDDDPLRYEWTFTGNKVQNRTAFPTFTFDKPGTYTVTLKVTDPTGASATATREIQVGNSPPEVAWEIKGNRTFYWDEGRIDYAVKVNDREDGSTDDGSIDPSRVNVNIDYLAEGFDLTQVAMGHQQPGMAAAAFSAFAKGKQLIDGSDCKSCHGEALQVNGPSYLNIANRYAAREDAVDYLAEKILRGGGGNWGETAMSAHPQLSKEEAAEMVKYILSLAGAQSVASKFPLKGSYATNRHEANKKEGAYVLMATYADRGNGDIRSVTSQQQLILRSPLLEAENAPLKSRGLRLATFKNNNDCLGGLTNGRHFGFQQIDLTGIASIQLQVVVNQPGKVTLHLDSPDSEAIAEAPLTAGEGLQSVELQTSDSQGQHDLYFVFNNQEGAGGVDVLCDEVQFIPEKLAPDPALIGGLE